MIRGKAAGREGDSNRRREKGKGGEKWQREEGKRMQVWNGRLPGWSHRVICRDSVISVRALGWGSEFIRH